MRKGTSIAIAGLVLASGACRRGKEHAVAGTTAYARPIEAVPAFEVAAPPSIAIARIGSFSRESSPVVLATVGAWRVAFVADEEESAIHTLDLAGMRAIATTPIAGKPSHLLVTADGELIVSRRDAASIAVLEAEAVDRPLRIAREVPTDDEPIAMALSPSDDVVWVATGWGRTLEGVELATGKHRATIALGREPRAVAIADDGKRAFVGYVDEPGIGVIDLAHATGALLPLGQKARAIEDCGWAVMPMPMRSLDDFEQGTPSSSAVQRFRCPLVAIPERVARQTFAFARVNVAGFSSRIVAPYVMVSAGEPQVITGGYGASGRTFDIDVFDVARIEPAKDASSIAAAKPLRDAGFCRLPRAAVASPQTGHVFVACIGDDRVAELDGLLDAPTIATWRTTLGGPSALAIDDERRTLFVLDVFARRLEQIALKAPRPPKKGEAWEFRNEMIGIDGWEGNDHLVHVTIALPHRDGLGLSAAAAAGRVLFHAADDRRISDDGRACASCHPDGRDDGLVWPTPRGPRQTIFLAGRVQRPAPFGWEGARESIPAHLKTTLANLHGTGLSDVQKDQLVAYLDTLTGPRRIAHEKTEEEARGEALFTSVAIGCSACHDDHGARDVMSATKSDRAKEFLAPSLRFVGGTAPYYHDGRYASLEDLVVGCDGTMAPTGTLNADDRRALVAYLKRL